MHQAPPAKGQAQGYASALRHCAGLRPCQSKLVLVHSRINFEGLTLNMKNKFCAVGAGRGPADGVKGWRA